MAKINVEKIELKNFFSYGNSWTEINFNEGINVVVGHDMDKERSNGAGKTSFLEAIPFALFGQTSKGVSLNKIINWKNGKKCEVKLTFTKDGVQYVIHRGIKPGIFELIKDGTPVPKLSDKRLFQQELENDLLGMDFKAAQALLFQNANNMVSMFNTPKAEKRKFLERFGNIEVYSQLNEVVNAKIRSIDQKLQEIEMETEFKRTRLKELNDAIDGCAAPNIESYENDFVAAEKRRDMFRMENQDILNTDVTAIDNEIACLTVERDSQKVLRDDFVASKSLVEKNISELQGERTQVINRLKAIGDLSEKRDTRAKLEEGLAKLSNVDAMLEGLETTLATYQNIIDEAGRKMSANAVEIRQLINEKNKWKGTAVLEDAECPTCFQTTDSEHIKTHVEACLVDVEMNLASVKERDAAQEKIYSEATVSKNETKAKMDKVRLLIKKKQEIQQKLASFSNLDELEQEVVELKERDDTITVELEALASSLEAVTDNLAVSTDSTREFNDKIESLKEKKSQLVSVNAQLESLEKDVDVAEKFLAEQRLVLVRINEEQEARVASKKAIEDELAGYTATIASTTTMKSYMEYIKTTLKDENVKQYAIGNIVPFLERQTNHYLSETGHNYYLKLDNWLEGEIHGVGVGECDFGNMSGGEGKSIDLALKFAMMDVARLQAGNYLDILVLDEILDSSIDSHGLEKLMEIVRMKQEEDNLKVFVVSHREELSEFDPDFVYKVTKQNGFSEIGLV